MRETPDATGDGIPELVVGAIYADRPDLQNAGYGQAYVIDPTTGAGISTLSAPRPNRNTLAGWSVASLSTTTAGQVTRIAVSAPTDKVRAVVAGSGVAAPSRAGRAYVFPLSLSFLSVAKTGEEIRLSLTAIAT